MSKGIPMMEARLQVIRSVDELGSLVRDVRRSQGLTQVELGELCNVGPRFIGELERGKPTAQIGKVLWVLSSLGLSLQVEHVVGTPEPATESAP